jgi:diguanylate cyclase (GGDEF)-like protein/PAS domain S-box-containing protein
MSLILIVSILIRLLAMGWSIVLFRQIKDWRMGFLTAMLGFMAMRQILTLWQNNESWNLLIIGHLTELPGLLVSIMAFLAIFFLKHILTVRNQAEEALHKSEANLKEAQHIAEIGSWELDLITHTLFWSDEVYRMFNLEPQEFDASYKSFLENIHPEDEAIVDKAYTDSVKNKTPYDIVHRLLLKDGTIKFVHERCHTFFDAAGRAVRSMGTIQDITELKQAEEKLRKLSRAVEATSSIVIITNLDGNMEYVNPKFTETTGYSREEAIGQNVGILQSGETPESVYVDLWKTVTSGGIWKGEFHNRKKDGSLYWDRASITGVKDAKGEITHFIAIQEDVTHEYVLTEKLSYQATHDSLTRLVNRREFERRAKRLLSTIRQDKTEHALCFMDLDQFKVVNDTCGHTAGDEMLRQLSMLLQHEVRQRDTLARLGGDEFGILIEHCSPNHAHRVATSLHKAIHDYQFSWEGQSFKVGVSIGLVAITEAIPDLTELMKQADAACYMAKELGRNRIHVYQADDSDMTRRHSEMRWVARINRALEEDRFCLYAQSIVPLDNSTDKHYELLFRMIDEEGKIIPPGAFLPAAERYDLITELDGWVIKNAFGLLAANPDFLDQINFISINLSGQTMADHTFLNFIISEMDKSGIECEKICFEITETAAISNLSKATIFISTLKEMGCRFALDDFGSGLSSFGYLKHLPVDYLKIDGMFVKDIIDDPIDYAMVKSINEIGQVMGMQTIAEFVENDEIKGMLGAIGVNHAQGYGIDKPHPFDELLDRSNNVIDIKNPKSNGSES